MRKEHTPFLAKRRLTSFRWALLGFLALILLGTFLLMLPVSSSTHEATSFLDCLFTATSASCVTGLTVVDTGLHWSLFGKIVIMVMIQIGGLGVITMTMALIRLSGRKISLYQRSVTQDSVSARYGGGVFEIVKYIIGTTLLLEGIGALLLSVPFVRDFGFMKGVGYAVFHSVSAFCNAGFDLMGGFRSLSAYADDIYVNIVIILLIISGGAGFFVLRDISRKKFRFSRYTFQSRVVIYTSLILIAVPAVYFFLFDFRDMDMKERILASLFQSVTTRTAGFNTADQGQLSDSASLITIILMLIGGSPGSTAGGMKTTTIAVLIISSIAVFNQTDDAHTRTRRIADSTIKAASAIFLLYMAMFITAAIVICDLEKIRLIDCLFETASAIGTVGITKGITPGLKTATRGILMFLMFFGRLGCLTIIYAALPRVRKEPAKVPLENISVG